MNGGSDRFDELHGYLDALCEDSITPDQMARLEQLVLSDPEIEARYTRFMRMQADLVRELGGTSPRPDQVWHHRPQDLSHSRAGSTGESRASRIGWLWGGAVFVRHRRAATIAAVGATAAAVFLVATVVMNAVRAPQISADPRPGLPTTIANDSINSNEPVDDSVAVLSQAVNADWADKGMRGRVGSPLPSGRLKLNSGLARLEFFCGAIVILEGPADFELVSSNRAYCHRGKLRVRIPPQAHGFQVGSPRIDLVDLGTEFGMSVGEARRTEVYVFEGKVELAEPASNQGGGTRRILTTGANLCIDENGVTRPAPAPESYVSAREMASRAAAEAQRRYREWRAASALLRSDPSLLAYYPIDTEGSSWDRMLDDRAGMNRDGAIVGCRWREGRWRGKRALEFRSVSDRVRISVPGEFDSLTLMAWVRVDSLDHPYNALLMSDGANEGKVHWQIEKGGTIKMGVQRNRSQPTPSTSYRGPVIFEPDKSGQWMHLAVVYDRPGRTVTHYVNGNPLVQLPITADYPLRIGDAEIGNWNQETGGNHQRLRNFNGLIDELAIFSRPLSHEEIYRNYSVGVPRG